MGGDTGSSPVVSKQRTSCAQCAGTCGLVA